MSTLRTRHAPRAVDVVAANVDRRDHLPTSSADTGARRWWPSPTTNPCSDPTTVEVNHSPPSPNACVDRRTACSSPLRHDLLGQALRAEERRRVVDRRARHGQGGIRRRTFASFAAATAATVEPWFAAGLVVARLVHPADEVHQRVDPRQDLQELVRMRPGAHRDLGAQLAERVRRIGPSHGRPDLVVTDERAYDRAPQDARRAGHHHGHRA